VSVSSELLVYVVIFELRFEAKCGRNNKGVNVMMELYQTTGENKGRRRGCFVH